MRSFFAAAVMALVVAVASPTALLAKGGYIPKPPLPVTASVLPLPSLPSVSPDEAFKGCGGRRFARADHGAVPRSRGPASLS